MIKEHKENQNTYCSGLLQLLYSSTWVGIVTLTIKCLALPFPILLSSPQEPPKMRGVKVVMGLKVVMFRSFWAPVHEAMIAKNT